MSTHSPHDQLSDACDPEVEQAKAVIRAHINDCTSPAWQAMNVIFDQLSQYECDRANATAGKTVCLVARDDAFDYKISIERDSACFTAEDALAVWRRACDDAVRLAEQKLSEALELRKMEVQ